MKRLPGLMVALWLALVGTGTVLLGFYKNIPGMVREAPIKWPAESKIALDPEKFTLVLLAHPKCPCTRATIGELEVLMARCSGQVSARVVFIQPEDTSKDWVQTDSWRQAAAIPGVTVLADPNGTEAQRFHGNTSGEAMLYNRHGHLLFQGGITLSRGHAGDNPGRSSIQALLSQAPAEARSTPVFGCPLFARECLEGGTSCKK